MASSTLVKTSSPGAMRSTPPTPGAPRPRFCTAWLPRTSSGNDLTRPSSSTRRPTWRTMTCRRGARCVTWSGPRSSSSGRP
eukprot:11159286-Lingulodinium_polyedra.AAC.1